MAEIGDKRFQKNTKHRVAEGGTRVSRCSSFRRFVLRGFAACALEDLPAERLKRVDRSRNSKSFLKHLREEVEEAKEAQRQLPSDLPKYGETVASNGANQARN